MIISSNPKLPSAFTTNYHGKKPSYEGALFYHLYTFKTKKNKRYLIQIDEFDRHIYILKFFVKNCLDSAKRYNMLTHDGEAFSIITTCMNALLHLKTEIDNDASFGFLGARKLSEESDNNTQRFRIYSKKGRTYFNPEHYLHIENIENSSYLILNRRLHDENSIPVINQMFQELYNLE
jgi:hypothetical protein